MPYREKEFTYASGDGHSHIAACLYTPESGPVRAVLQLAHGMRDYVGRYREMAEYLCDRGIAFCGNDHVGHGETARHSEELGFFGAEDGTDVLLTDMHKLTLLMRAQYRGTPLFLCGQGMGSLLSRMYACSYYRDIDGVILAGTGNHPLAGVGCLAANMVIRRKGANYRSEKMNAWVPGRFNRHFIADPYGFNYLTRNDEKVAHTASDPRCNFTLTASAYYDIFHAAARVSAKGWARQFPKGTPVLLCTGKDDPVGHFGRDARSIAARLRGCGVQDVTEKYYPDARHELHSEACSRAYFEDVAAWITAHL